MRPRLINGQYQPQVINTVNAWGDVLQRFETDPHGGIYLDEQYGSYMDESPPKRTFESYQHKDGPDYDLSYAQSNHNK